MDKLKLLYIGNKLSGHGKNESGVEFIGKILAQKYSVVSCSTKLNPLLRMFDSIGHIIRFAPKMNFCLLDVYSSSNFYLTVAYSFFLKIYRAKFLCILHGGNLPHRLENSPKLCSYVFGSSHALISPSNYLKTEFAKYGYASLLIPNSIPIKNYPFGQRQNFKPKLLYVRAFHKVYNPVMALESLYSLRQEGINASLCMVGPDKDGSLNICQEKCRELNLQEYVEFKGQMSKEGWIKLSQHFDVFINTTDFDNTPVSVMEAMALGMVVVSTNVGGVPYLIQDGENGFLVPPKNPKAMAHKIKLILEDPQKLVEVSHNARKTVEEFDENAVLEKWEKLLEKQDLTF